MNLGVLRKMKRSYKSTTVLVEDGVLYKNNWVDDQRIVSKIDSILILEISTSTLRIHTM